MSDYDREKLNTTNQHPETEDEIKLKVGKFKEINWTFTVQSNRATAMYLASGLTTTAKTSSFIFAVRTFDNTRDLESWKPNRKWLIRYHVEDARILISSLSCSISSEDFIEHSESWNYIHKLTKKERKRKQKKGKKMLRYYIQSSNS